jgi:hypothetical protein
VRLLPVGLLAGLLLLAGPAQAETPAQVAAALQRAPVHQTEGLDLVDAAALTAELTGTDPQVAVAVVDAGASAERQATAVLAAVGDPELVLLVVTSDQQLAAVAGTAAGARGVQASKALKDELAGSPPLPYDRAQMTALVGAFAQRVAGQVSGDGPDVTRTVPPAAAPTASAVPSLAAQPRDGSRSGWGRGLLLAGGGLVVGLALGVLVGRRH